MPPEREYMDTPLHEKAGQIAANMGWEWSYSFDDSYNGSAAIVGPDGMTVVVSASGFRFDESERLEITGRFPEATFGPYREVFDPRPEKRPRIGVAASRPAHSIARDILRRFLPAYVPLYEDGLERKGKYLQALARREAALERLARILGADRPADSRDRREEVRVPQRGLYGRIRVSYDGDEANVDVSSVPIEVVYQIAELLAACE